MLRDEAQFSTQFFLPPKGILYLTIIQMQHHLLITITQRLTPTPYTDPVSIVCTVAGSENDTFSLP